MAADRAIVLTPPGAAAIAVIRIAGPGVAAFLAKHFTRLAKLDRAVHGELRNGEVIIDDPLIVLEQDLADINVHGGAWIVASVIRMLRSEGFEIVTESLDLLDGADIFDREMNAALPLASTEQGLRLLLAQPAAWRRLLASSPAREQLHAIAADRSLWFLLHPPTVAIIGAPNVGKSTLANQLFGQDRSITADLPGTTRDYVGELANIDGLPVMLVDTPGLRESADPIEREAIRRSRSVVENADLQLVISDSIQPGRLNRNQLSVVNKADLLTQRTAEACFTIATTGEGVDALKRRIKAFFSCDDLSTPRARWWTQRQHALLADQSTIRAMS